MYVAISSMVRNWEKNCALTLNGAFRDATLDSVSSDAKTATKTIHTWMNRVMVLKRISKTTNATQDAVENACGFASLFDLGREDV